MKTLLKNAFTAWPFCLATYVGLIGMTWLLLSSGRFAQVDIPVTLCDSRLAAEAQAHMAAVKLGATVFAVTDTGSMRPALQGGDFVVTRRDALADVKAGDVLIYRATWRPTGANLVIHRAVQKDSHGWIMSGDSAPHSESFARVTEANYHGRVIPPVFRAR